MKSPAMFRALTVRLLCGLFFGLLAACLPTHSQENRLIPQEQTIAQ